MPHIKNIKATKTYGWIFISFAAIGFSSYPPSESKKKVRTIDTAFTEITVINNVLFIKFEINATFNNFWALYAEHYKSF